MSLLFRLIIFFPAALLLGGLLIWGLSGLPEFGNYPGPYGDLINQGVVLQRHITNAPTAVNFDYRGLDTMGEEYILFASVAAVILLFRKEWKQLDDRPEDPESTRKLFPPSEAVQWFGFLLVPVLTLFGIYVVLFGTPTPGGGFHGGVIVGSSSLLVYLTVGTAAFRKSHPREPVDISGAVGAGGYVLVGIGGLIAGGAFLQNVLPLGPIGEIISGGTIAVINFAVGMEVATAFILLFSEFIKEMTQRKEGEE